MRSWIGATRVRTITTRSRGSTMESIEPVGECHAIADGRPLCGTSVPIVRVIRRDFLRQLGFRRCAECERAARRRRREAA